MLKALFLIGAVFAGFGAVINAKTPWFIPDAFICILFLTLFWVIRAPRDISGKIIRR